jgi:glycosyltransferase involved in cell wall biosynthesis
VLNVHVHVSPQACGVYSSHAEVGIRELQDGTQNNEMPNGATSSPLVTIVIINFNYGAYIKAAVESALAQTHSPTEVIVVDDGSTDDSLRTLAEFDTRVRVVCKEQGGHVSAFNAGFAASRGEILIFLDADDKLYPDCVKTVVRSWCSRLSKVQFRLDTIDADGNDQHMRFPRYSRSLNHDEIRRRLLRFGYYPWPVSSGNAYARNFIAQVTPIPQERIFKSPDGYVNKIAPLFGEVRVLDRVLGAYRVHGRNVWAQSGEEINRDIYGRTVRFDVVLHAEFVALAAKFGFAVAGYEKQPVPQWVENRLLSLRFAPEKHPIQGDTVWGVYRFGLRAAIETPGINILGHLAWMAWFTALATLPESGLVRRARAQSKRSMLARALVELSNRP